MDGKRNPFRSGPIRSVSGGDEKRRRENLTERDINNINNIYNNTTRSVPLEKGVRGKGELREQVRRFVSDVKSHLETDEWVYAFYDSSYSTVTICLALTGDYGSVRRWRQFEREIPDEVLRRELEKFYAEIRSGEDVRNRGATLNKRLGRFLARNAKGGAR